MKYRPYKKERLQNIGAVLLYSTDLEWIETRCRIECCSRNSILRRAVRWYRECTENRPVNMELSNEPKTLPAKPTLATQN